jgi:hypothetical protein
VAPIRVTAKAHAHRPQGQLQGIGSVRCTNAVARADEFGEARFERRYVGPENEGGASNYAPETRLDFVGQLPMLKCEVHQRNLGHRTTSSTRLRVACHRTRAGLARVLDTGVPWPARTRSKVV